MPSSQSVIVNGEKFTIPRLLVGVVAPDDLENAQEITVEEYRKLKDDQIVIINWDGGNKGIYQVNTNPPHEMSGAAAYSAVNPSHWEDWRFDRIRIVELRFFEELKEASTHRHDCQCVLCLL
jgi:hypothetical protein